jgi:hypothetical protein
MLLPATGLNVTVVTCASPIDAAIGSYANGEAVIVHVGFTVDAVPESFFTTSVAPEDEPTYGKIVWSTWLAAKST